DRRDSPRRGNRGEPLARLVPCPPLFPFPIPHSPFPIGLLVGRAGRRGADAAVVPVGQRAHRRRVFPRVLLAAQRRARPGRRRPALAPVVAVLAILRQRLPTVDAAAGARRVLLRAARLVARRPGPAPRSRLARRDRRRVVAVVVQARRLPAAGVPRRGTVFGLRGAALARRGSATRRIPGGPRPAPRGGRRPRPRR